MVNQFNTVSIKETIQFIAGWDESKEIKDLEDLTKRQKESLNLILELRKMGVHLGSLTLLKEIIVWKTEDKRDEAFHISCKVLNPKDYQVILGINYAMMNYRRLNNKHPGEDR